MNINIEFKDSKLVGMTVNSMEYNKSQMVELLCLLNFYDEMLLE